MIVKEEPEECVLLIEELDFSSVSSEQITVTALVVIDLIVCILLNGTELVSA